MTDIKKSCRCEVCRAACEYNPGWFMPDQIAPLATAMGITEQELFDRHLAVNWYEESGDEDDEDYVPETFVLAPAIRSSAPGQEYPGDPRGVCRWYQKGKCAVHNLGKPFECASLSHDSTRNEQVDRHRGIARAWIPHQRRIKELLGREPVAKEYYLPLSSLLGSFFR